MPTRLRPKKTYEELIAGYYGVSTPPPKPSGQPAGSLSLSRDDGEVIAQQPAPSTNGDQHVVYAAPTPAAAEEYVVVSPAEPATGSPVDEVLPPVAAAAPPPPPPPARAPVPAAESPAPVAAAASVEEDEDELARDMQAILSGQKVFDPASGRTVPRDEAGAPAAPRPDAPPQVNDDQAIFDRIAESMTYANAYDLGTHELENRFADFDRIDDIDRRARDKRPTPEVLPAEPSAPKVTGADFLDDLDQLRERAVEVGADAVHRAIEAMPQAHTASVEDDGGHPGCGPSALNLSLGAAGPAFAHPMYDAGEHAQAAGDLYADMLHVGSSPGVLFSYGELIAMGDLYDTVEDMMGADPPELTTLKGLIDRNTRYYVTGKSNKALDVGNEEWDKATHERYLKLAEENYKHFAPNTLFTDAASLAAVTHGNHKSAWEEHHRRAIEEAQRLALLPENQNRSYVPERALIINAFGDHFLTDAFASGHLINKDVMIAKFRAKFYSGGSLTSAAQNFFERVAKAAFVGEVRKKFSVLETYEPVFLWWNPNIDTTNAFRKLLVKVAEEQPDTVGNLAVKALHDYLNKKSIKVTNAAGHDPWDLTGDGFLNTKTLPIMRQAVEQSIANVNDPSIQQSNLNFGPYFERVWRYVPQLTPASQATVRHLVEEYTDPTSAVLSAAAAQIIHDQVDSMIKVAIRDHKLKPA
jgi:hypothetical protein